MAKSTTRLGKATFVQKGFGQLEPNHLSARRSGRVYAQLPAAANIDLLENGQFVKYDYAKGVCDFSTEASSGAWMMVFNEVKIYEDRETDADFAMKKADYNGRVYSPVGQDTSALRTVVGNLKIGTYNYPQYMPKGTTMVPRVLHVEIGDIFTTNTIMAAPGSLKVGDMLEIGEDGYLTTKSDAEGGDLDPIFAVVKVYTMPDNQPGVKLQRVA